MINHEIIISITILLLIASIVAFIVSRIRVPYSTALVITGLVISYYKLLPGITLSPDLVLNVFLPILLFESAIMININRFRENWVPILFLAVPGVFIAMLVTGSIIHFAIGLPWLYSFLIAVILAPTDTISVLAIFKKLKLPAKLSNIMEGEVLLNDGSAIVLFKTILVMLSLSHVNYILTGLNVVWVIIGGVVVGGICGYFAAQLIKPQQDNMVEITLTFVLAFGAYQIAEAIHVSGVIAVVMAGIFIGTYGWRRVLTTSTQIVLASFWQFIAFVVNSIVFLLIGFGINFELFATNILAVVIAFAAVFIGRIVSIYPAFSLFNRFSLFRGPINWQHIFVWGNIKGSISMAMALSLPDSTPYKDIIVSIIFGVVLASLVLQGLTLAPLIKFFNLSNTGIAQYDYEYNLAQVLTSRKIQEELDIMYNDGLIPIDIYNRMRSKYQVSYAKAERELRKIHDEVPDIALDQYLSVEEKLLLLEKVTINNCIRDNIISTENGDQMIDKINQKLIKVVNRKNLRNLRTNQ